MSKFCGQDVIKRSQGALCERQEVAINESPVIAHIKAKSKVLITKKKKKKAN